MGIISKPDIPLKLNTISRSLANAHELWVSRDDNDRPFLPLMVGQDVDNDDYASSLSLYLLLFRPPDSD